MKRFQTSICVLGLCAAVLSPPTAKAAFVNFIEGAEGSPVAVTFSATGAFGDWSTVFGVTTTSTPESATFTGYMTAGFGTGKYAIGLTESLNGPLSDWVTIDWHEVFGAGGPLTQFDLVFKSDTEGVPLLPPVGYSPGEIRVEDGTLQVFHIPIAGLDVGMKSDTETPVPEPSTYIAGALLLLPFGAQAVRRLRTRKQ